jgi:hypothetical protein
MSKKQSAANRRTLAMRSGAIGALGAATPMRMRGAILELVVLAVSEDLSS